MILAFSRKDYSNWLRGCPRWLWIPPWTCLPINFFPPVSPRIVLWSKPCKGRRKKTNEKVNHYRENKKTTSLCPHYDDGEPWEQDNRAYLEPWEGSGNPSKEDGYLHQRIHLLHSGNQGVGMLPFSYLRGPPRSNSGFSLLGAKHRIQRYLSQPGPSSTEETVRRNWATNAKWLPENADLECLHSCGKHHCNLVHHWPQTLQKSLCTSAT